MYATGSRASHVNGNFCIPSTHTPGSGVLALALVGWLQKVHAPANCSLSPDYLLSLSLSLLLVTLVSGKRGFPPGKLARH